MRSMTSPASTFCIWWRLSLGVHLPSGFRTEPQGYLSLNWKAAYSLLSPPARSTYLPELSPCTLPEYFVYLLLGSGFQVPSRWKVLFLPCVFTYHFPWPSVFMPYFFTSSPRPHCQHQEKGLVGILTEQLLC